MESRPKKLLDQVRDVIRLKHYSPKTEESYVHWIKRYIFFHDKRHPMGMGEEEIETFLTHLATKERVAASTDIRTVQELLGHKDVQTTMIYTHVMDKGPLGVRSPIDSPPR